MLHALALSIGQLGDRRIMSVLVRSIALTLAIFVLLGAGMWWLARAGLERAGWDGGGLAALVAALVTGMALWLLFRGVAIAVVGLFGDSVVEAVEARHYPAALARARPVPFSRAAAMGVGSVLRVVAVNLVALPVYLLLLATGVGTAAAFLAVNAWALGRDLGDMVAARHMDAAAMRGWRKATRGRRFLLGLAMTLLFVVPLLGLVAPVLGAAMATHLFHGGRR